MSDIIVLKPTPKHLTTLEANPAHPVGRWATMIIETHLSNIGYKWAGQQRLEEGEE